MNESDFHTWVDALYMQLEDCIDDSGADLDYETAGGVMTIICEANGSQIILSRQPSTCEVWVAAKSGGFHFRQQEGDWYCATGETLSALLQRVIAEQSGATLDIELPQ